MGGIPDRIYTKDRGLFDRLKKLSFADLYRTPVSTLPLNARALHVLEERLKVRTIGQLVTRTRFELLKQRNFGRKSLTQVEVYLRELRLSLGVNPAVVERALAPVVTEQQTFEWAAPPEPAAAPTKTAREAELEALLADATAMVAKMAAALGNR